ncbi:hypothetical protein [Streptomyces sp. Y1]|uniref:Uncharacterized protein n=1 Tax=Streptomyces sp. Y1 TaxID=3238634 RepID=A0AB39TGF5_9ACTN
MRLRRDRNPPAEFRLRFAWTTGFCFKCEEVTQVAELGTLTVEGETVTLAACHLCAWRLERQHHQARQAHLRAQLAGAWTGATRRAAACM